MSYLRIRDLSSKVADFSLRAINLEIEKGEYFVLLGQSGSGKTRLLEAIAGLSGSEGTIFYEDDAISQKSPEHRDIGFVYQDFALFPNLNVEKNIIFSGKFKRIKNAQEHFEDIVAFLDLKDLLTRAIADLSGGEKQRVAIARALYSQPKILLLDEPLSAIDPTFRNTIMKKLKEIHKHFDLTTIHVTHNFREASYLADKIAILMEGTIEQVGTPDEVLNAPKNIDVARFLGFKNIFPVTLLSSDCKTEYFSVDPNAIRLLKEESQQYDYTFKGFVEECINQTDHFKIFVNADEKQFFIKIPKREYNSALSDPNVPITIGFNERDIAYL